MKDKKYNSDSRLKELNKMEELYKKIESHHKYLKHVNKKFKEIDSDLEILEKYYQTEWLKDYENFDSSKKNFYILLEDPIYDIFRDISSEKVKILKKIVAKLR